MQWIRTPNPDQAVADLSQRLTTELQARRRVLWLLSGGSNIALSVRIMECLPAALSAGLSISLLDERYGPPGHAESNWAKLEQAGFPFGQARLLPVLRPGLDFDQTRTAYETILEQALRENDYTLGQAGIGDDGHIAGILPLSVAAGPTGALIVGYHGKPYDRLSLSFAALKRLSSVYALAFGPAKGPELTRLHNQDLPPTEQPAQILKQLADAYVYNDQVA